MSFAMFLESICTTIFEIAGCFSPINVKYAKHYYIIYFVFVIIFCMLEVCKKKKSS